jgi:lipopolysaccharide export system permease protein
LIALATTAGNPRAGRGGNLFITLFAFVFYYNLLNLGQSWVAGGLMGLGGFMLTLHGGVFVLTVLWLFKRHYNLSVGSWINRWRNAGTPMQGTVA